LDAGLHPNFRRYWKYYLFGGYALPIIVVGVIVAFAILLGISQPDFTLRRSLAALIPNAHLVLPPITPRLWLILIFQIMIIAVPLGTIVAWGEEFGWRGYLQVRLFATRPFLAAIVTGVIWGVWHYPLILFGYEHYENVWLGLLVFPVCTVMLSIIFGWLRLKTNSVWASCLAHGATNAIGLSITLLLFLGAPHFMYVSYLGILSWVPLGAICAWICPSLINARNDRFFHKTT
jgi:membrane protease YdiL (CAAX protease family)